MRLRDDINTKPKAKVVKHELHVKPAELQGIFNKWVYQKRHEGLVIHAPLGAMFKAKNMHEIDAIIIGFTEDSEVKKVRGKNSVSTLITALMRKDGTYQVLAQVKSGIKDVQRVDLYDLLCTDVIKSYYKAKTVNGKSFKFVRPKHVIQIRFLDLITEGADGKNVIGTSLHLDNDRWLIVEKNPFLGLINPWFDVFRGNVDPSFYPSLQPVNPKEPEYHDVKIDQVYPLLWALKDIGSVLTRKAFMDEIFKRTGLVGQKSLVSFLAREGYVSDEYFSQEELQAMVQDLDIFD